jgi:hypothetical protein
LPVVFADGGETINNGRFLKYLKNYSLSKYHLATLQRMGVGVEEFADAESPMSSLIKDV